jgi:putative transposase
MQNANIYAGYRYPLQIISHAVWLYHRFTLSFRDIEELLAARGITVSYETIGIDMINLVKGIAVKLGRTVGN